MTRRYKTGRNKRVFFEEVQSLYLAGKDLEEIQEMFPVTLQTLKRWRKEGHWEEKRRHALVSPRWLGEALKGVLRDKTGKLLDSCSSLEYPTVTTAL